MTDLLTTKSLGGLISLFLTKRVDFVIMDPFDSLTKMSDELLVSQCGSRAKMLLATALSWPSYHKKHCKKKVVNLGLKCSLFLSSRKNLMK